MAPAQAVATSLPPAGLPLLAIAIEQMSEAVVITDVKATIQYVNPAFTRTTGYSAAEAVGKNIRILKSERQKPNHYRDLWNTILSGEVWRGELVNQRKDGSLCSQKISITPVRNQTGAITNFVAVSQNLGA